MRLPKNALLYASSCYSPFYLEPPCTLFHFLFLVVFNVFLMKKNPKIKKFRVMNTRFNSNEENLKNFCAVDI